VIILNVFRKNMAAIVAGIMVVSVLPQAQSATQEKLDKKVRQSAAQLDPEKIIPEPLLDEALVFFESNKPKIRNKNFITIIDYGMNSSNKRMFVVDIKSGGVESFLTAHGKGSDMNHDGFADSFSNQEGSLKSSLGFAVTAETYEGDHGYSLVMDGLSPSNSADRQRMIVFHSAWYVDPQYKPLGRSHGCPAVEVGLHYALFDQIKGGSLIYKASTRHRSKLSRSKRLGSGPRKSPSYKNP